MQFISLYKIYRNGYIYYCFQHLVFMLLSFVFLSVVLSFFIRCS